MNPFDRLLAAVSPSWALSRARSRLELELYARGYEAATKGERFSDFRATNASSNELIVASFDNVLARARYLERNSWIVKKAQAVYTNNAVGTGIKCKIQSESDAEEKRLQAIWDEWVDTADITGKQSFYGLQSLLFGSLTLTGNGLARIIRQNSSSKSIIPLKLQPLEIDHLDLARNIRGNPEVRNGFELDDLGATTALYLFTRHPQEQSAYTREQSIRIANEDILHLFKQERPGQRLGMSFYSNVILRIKMHDDYDDATLERQRISRSITGFIKNNQGETPPGEKKSLSFPVAPGRVYRLGPNEDFAFANPPDPTDYNGFSKQVLKTISAGLLITYESLTGDLSDVNYSSMRAGWLEFSRNVMSWQDLIIQQLCKPVFRQFSQYAGIRGLYKKDIRAQWIPPRREMLDVVKETDAIIRLIQAGLLPFTDALIEMGKDPEKVIEQLKKDVEKLTALNLSFSWMQDVIAGVGNEAGSQDFGLN